MNLNTAKSSRRYLYEGLTPIETNTVKLWEDAGSKILEAELTSDQIKSLFTNIEQAATGAGGNRTLLGKGKDAAESINRAWEDLKTKIQDSGPIKNLDAKYDSAADKLKQATGGDQGVMKYVQKYRDFAKKHPVAQAFIYSALIAAAGISGAGVGGAAALGLFKMVDKLLQGDKFSSAAYSGAKTGAAAYGASKIGDLVKGGGQAADAATGGAELQDAAKKASINAIDKAIQSGQITNYNSALDVTDQIMANVGKGLSPDFRNALERAVRNKLVSATTGNIKESIDLSESQIYIIVDQIIRQQRKLDEGIMDTLKGAAGKAADWAKTKGTNLTTKVTADKLLSAWKKAGSPTDSEAVADILKKSGVNGDIVSKAFAAMKIPQPAAGEPAQQADKTQGQAQGADTKQIIAQIQADIKMLDSTRRNRLIAYLQKQVGA